MWSYRLYCKTSTYSWKRREEARKILRTKLVKKFGGEFKVVLKDVRLPELSAKIMGEFAATQLEVVCHSEELLKHFFKK